MNEYWSLVTKNGKNPLLLTEITGAVVNRCSHIQGVEPLLYQLFAKTTSASKANHIFRPLIIASLPFDAA